MSEGGHVFCLHSSPNLVYCFFFIFPVFLVFSFSIIHWKFTMLQTFWVINVYVFLMSKQIKLPFLEIIFKSFSLTPILSYICSRQFRALMFYASLISKQNKQYIKKKVYLEMMWWGRCSVCWCVNMVFWSDRHCLIASWLSPSLSPWAGGCVCWRFVSLSWCRFLTPWIICFTFVVPYVWFKSWPSVFP